MLEVDEDPSKEDVDESEEAFRYRLLYRRQRRRRFGEGAVDTFNFLLPKAVGTEICEGPGYVSRREEEEKYGAPPVLGGRPRRR